MEHLTPEALARLVDEPPTPEERGHLNRCRRCRDEVDALQAQALGLSHLPDLRPPQGEWPLLEARLLEEGLLNPGTPAPASPATPASLPSSSPAGSFTAPAVPVRGGTPSSPRRIRPWGRRAWQGAAAVALLVTGAILGAGGVLALRGGPSSGGAPAPGGGPSGLVASEGPLADVPVALGLHAPLRTLSVEEVEEAVRITESWYLAALLRYRDRAGSKSPDPFSRYLALETLVAAGQVALREAPADPFLNGLLVTMDAERQAALQGIQTASREMPSPVEGGGWF